MSTREDWLAEFLAKQAKETAEGKAYLLGLIPTLTESGIAKMVVHYDGSGDSGDIEDIQFQGADGQQVKLDISAMEEKIKDAVYYVLEGKHGGWEINEGSFGDVVLNVANATITIEHNQRFEDSTYSEDEA